MVVSHLYSYDNFIALLVLEEQGRVTIIPLEREILALEASLSRVTLLSAATFI